MGSHVIEGVNSVLLYLIAVVVYGLDQWIKWIVRTHMSIGQSIPVLPGVLQIQFIRNVGGAFGILPHQYWLFVLVALVVVGAAVFIDRRFHPVLVVRIGLGLLLGGAIGNMSDRIFAGSVVDYVSVTHFAIFNFADVSIDIGILILILQSFRSDKSHDDSAKDVDVQ